MEDAGEKLTEEKLTEEKLTREKLIGENDIEDTEWKEVVEVFNQKTMNKYLNTFIWRVPA